MKKTLCLFTALIAFPFLSPVTAGEKPFPAKNPVLKFELPEKWKTEADAKDGSLAMESPDGRIAIHFAPVPVEASLEVFEKILPDMLKELKDAAVVDKAKEHTEDGLTGYTATYAAKIDDKPAMCIFVIFKGDAEHSVLGTIFVGEAETLPKEDSEALGAFMKSLKGAK
jgi:predicted Zn-dependent protease